MLLNGLNAGVKLASAPCPRCKMVGLIEINDEDYQAVSKSDKHRPECLLEPSLAARCPACSLVMEWPGCFEG